MNNQFKPALNIYRTNVNYSYFKYNVLLLIRTNLFYYFQLIYIFLCVSC